MNILDMIRKTVPNVDMKEVHRCMRKATHKISEGGVYLVVDDKYIYYFGALPESRCKSKLGVFVKKYKHLAEGKVYYSSDNSGFSRKSKHIEGTKYEWS